MPAQRRKLASILLLHGMAVLSLGIAIMTLKFVEYCRNDERVHALGCTFIFHNAGQLIVRLPSNELVTVNAFTRVQPSIVYLACEGYLAFWLIFMLVWVHRRWQTRRGIVPRGFPLD